MGKQEVRCEESVVRIESLLSKIYFQPGGGVRIGIVASMERTENFSQEDREGTDILVVLTDEFAQFTGIRELGIQSKSSETGVVQFANVGKKKFGRSGDEWKRIGRILLNGQWADGSIVTDFLVQLMNLMGIYGNGEEMRDFVSCFDETTVTAFGGHYLQVEQYRCHLLEWVAGRPRQENGGKLFLFD